MKKKEKETENIVKVDHFSSAGHHRAANQSDSVPLLACFSSVTLVVATLVLFYSPLSISRCVFLSKIYPRPDNGRTKGGRIRRWSDGRMAKRNEIRHTHTKKAQTSVVFQVLRSSGNESSKRRDNTRSFWPHNFDSGGIKKFPLQITDPNKTRTQCGLLVFYSKKKFRPVSTANVGTAVEFA